MTRHCVMSTLCVDNWDSVFCLDDYCKEELYFWKDNLINLNSRYCFVSKDPSYFVYSDASATGGGAFIDFNNDFVSQIVDGERKFAKLNMERVICY